jgi:histidine triad (HIT) family protein
MAVVQAEPRIREAVGADGVLIAQFNGAAAGQTVFHLRSSSRAKRARN